MRISIDWFKEFVKTNDSTEDIANTLTMLGLEAENPVDITKLEDIIIGEVVECKKHPNADRLKQCKVSDGKLEIPIICGAPNVDKGQKIALAPVGASLPGGINIKKAKIRGEESQGMICSEKELGISDEHEGIMVLPSDAKIGQKFKDFYLSSYSTIDLDITPNRADCFSHFGVARDYAAKKGLKIKSPQYDPRSFKSNLALKKINVSIENPDECPRYIAGIVKNIKVKDSPKWLRQRLESIGQRSINNIVDISNYVMMEIGQPTHIFDYEKFGSKEILIRRGKKNEKLTTLDEIEREVSPNELLITNGKNPVAIAGVMGGLNSAVTSSTTTVIIESAYFDPPTIRKSAKSVNMSTDSSKRFERGADPNAAEHAFWRIISLLEEYAEGEWVPGLVDAYPKAIKPASILLRKEKLDLISGLSIKDNYVDNSLKMLGCIVEKEGDNWKCNAPTWRPDLEREIDLIEEIIRLYGYDKIESTYHYQSLMENNIIDPHLCIDKICNTLHGLGFTQIFSNTLLSEKETSINGIKTINVMNPLSDKMTHLRSSLIPGLLNTADFNHNNGRKDLMLFEIGNVFNKTGKGLKGINENFQLSGIILGDLLHPSVHQSNAIKSDFFAIKGLVSTLLNHLQIGKVEIDTLNTDLAQYEKSFLINIDKTSLGHYGKINSKILHILNLDISNIYAFEINLDHLIGMINQSNLSFNPIIYYPTVERDINFVLEEKVVVGDVLKSILNKNNQIIKNVNPQNIFRHSSIGKNKKSVTFKLIFQHPLKTLEDKDVNLVIDEIIKVVSKDFGAKLR